MDNSGQNMAGSIPKNPNDSNGEREQVNPEATGAAKGAKVLVQKANFSESTYGGSSPSMKSAGL